jgi:FkbM family methyltransferase
LPYRILEQAGEIPSGFELLADDVSRNEFLTQLRWRCLMDYDCLPAHEPPADMYFSPDIVQLTNEEVLIDCGAFDGDSVKLFLDRVNSRFRRILAMEPDPTNQKALAAYVASLPAETSAKIEVFPYALGKESRTVWFRADGTVSSKITDNKDGVEVQVRRLDDLLEGSECPTIIKMDIEGAEVDAIPGAAKTIARCRPILAVCAYHRCEHLWQIPKLLQAANPGYRIFLRRYAEECWETVYYAIPPERLV